ncbi:LRRGT00056 [Rattus norvegicus]|uniref:LRRGT00056 n=2 Tax=Rattus norvegicus TaxID=10116 RepID=F7FGJ9_RAT|nr:LRRGT00056 [Rattus norvegicus]EDM01018.1 LRRGT00056 [Rattus norvegicus]|eukprot:NP_001041412.1 uncharacterized protein LOC499573 [Rattus norvegicus]
MQLNRHLAYTYGSSDKLCFAHLNSSPKCFEYEQSIGNLRVQTQKALVRNWLFDGSIKMPAVGTMEMQSCHDSGGKDRMQELQERKPTSHEEFGQCSHVTAPIKGVSEQRQNLTAAILHSSGSYFSGPSSAPRANENNAGAAEKLS